jgi:hypothetical protein
VYSVSLCENNNKAKIMSTIRRRLNWHLANKKTSNSNNGPIADNEEPWGYFSNAFAAKYFIY